MSREISTYNQTPSANDFDVADGGAPPGLPRKEVDDTTRIRMAELANLYRDGIEWLNLCTDPLDRSTNYTVSRASATTIDINSGTEDLSSIFNVGRRIQLTTAGVKTDYLEVESVSYLNPTTTVTVVSGIADGSVTEGIDGILLMVISTLGRFAFLGSLPSDYIVPATLDEAGLLAALATANSAGGGTVLLENGTYVMPNQDVAIGDNVRIIGQGKGSSKIQFTGEAGNHLFEFGGACALESLTIEDTGTKVAGTRYGVRLETSNASDSLIRDVDILTPTGLAGVYMDAASMKAILFDNVRIYRPAFDGFKVVDATSNLGQNKMSNCTVEGPGFGGSATAYGFKMTGMWEMTNISVLDIDIDGPAAPVGVVFGERIAIDPDPQDAHACSLSNLTITGTGANAIGLEQNGRRCVVSGGSIKLTGSSSVGGRVAGSIGAQEPEGNLLIGMRITAALGYEQASTIGHDNTISACHFNDCGADVRLAAAGAMVFGNSMDGAITGPSIQIQGTASSTTIFDNVIRDNTGDGISVEGTAEETVLSDNYLVACAGDGIVVGASALDCQVNGNRAVRVVGADYVNLAGSECMMIDNFPMDEERTAFKTSNETLGAAEENIADLIALPFPLGDGGPDGSKLYGIHFSFPVEFDSVGHFEFSLYVGTSGDKSDTQVSEWLYEADAGVDRTVNGLTYVQPAAGDLFGFSVDNITGSVEVDIKGSATVESVVEKCVVIVRRLRG